MNLPGTLNHDLSPEIEYGFRPIGPEPYDLEDNEILARQRRWESNARSYPRRIPLVLTRAKGIYVEDIEGRTFIDCLAGAGSLILGHNHPVSREAMLEIISRDLPLHTLDLATPTKDKFIADLLGILPKVFSDKAKIQFCSPAGTDAVEAALKLVRTATGRRTILSFQGAYHGMSHGALGLMGNHAPKRALDGLFNGVQFLPFPYDYRCPFGIGGEAGINANLNLIESVLTDPESGTLLPAGIIVEVIQGEGGVVPAPVSWLVGLRGITARAGVPLIIDEVQTGFGRTGELFAFEKSGIVPDVLILSKATGGGLPLSLIVYSADLDLWEPGAHAGTFRGNQMAMAAGSATMRYLQKEKLHHHAEKMGARLIGHLSMMQSAYLEIGDVRGQGLMIGVELVDPGLGPDRLGHAPIAPDLAAAVQHECLKRGLIVEVGGRKGSVIRFLPPLIVTEGQIDQIAEIFAMALRAGVADKHR
jgi:diaminobutyrate-2-oxoglutarate transaminase